jgi:hypothetical protein
MNDVVHLAAHLLLERGHVGGVVGVPDRERWAALIGGQSVEVVDDDVAIEQVAYSFQPSRAEARYSSTSWREWCAAP